MRKKSLNAECSFPPSKVVAGLAQSVYQLYRDLVLGTGVVNQRPLTYDDNPDIDSPDPFNSFGLELDELHNLQKNSARILEEEKAKATKADEGVSTEDNANADA